MARYKLFTDRPPRAVTLAEPSLARWYARRARLALFAVGVPAGLLTTVAVATVVPPVAAVLVGTIAGAVLGLAAAVLVRVWPVLRALWHWAFEITTAAAMIALAGLLSSATHPLVAVGLIAGLAGVSTAVAPVRRHVAAWVWCTVVRHRLRLCFAEFIRAVTRTRPASLPLILLARPTPAGERVWVWLRPGLDLSDLDGKTGRVAVACWAGEVRVVRASTRYAALIRVDINRRDPLTAVVPSPLAALVPRQRTGTAVPPGLPPLGLDLADVPEELPEPPARLRR